MTNTFLLASDLDGTLIYTEKALVLAYTKTFENMNIKIDDLSFLKHGLAFNQICQKIGVNETDKIIKLRELKDKFYFENLSLTKVNLPIFDLIQSVSRSGKIAIVTNARRISAQTLLEWHNLTEYIDYLITSDDVKNSKPDPEPYLELLRRSGFEANRVVAIEDSEIGKISALKANILTLLIIE
jgi:HAD superfamily hydrolase (TIGR01509 family)